TNDVMAASTAVDATAAGLERLAEALAAQREATGAGEAALRDLDDRVRRGEGALQIINERRSLNGRRREEIARDAAALDAELTELRAAALEAEEEAAGVPDDALVADVQAQEQAAREQQSAALRALNEADDALRRARGQAGQLEDRLGRAERGLRSFAREREEQQARRTALLGRLRRDGVEILRLRREQASARADEAAIVVEAENAKRNAAAA